MTTASWSTVVDHTSDAGFRAWGSELNAKFAAVGMVNTADTGQINWATVTRPGTTTSAGYEIWKLSGGALYFKIEYGTGSSAANPSFWVTVGTGSNGSGTLTGDLSTRTQCGMYGNGLLSTVTSYQSYLCATADYVGLSWKIGSVVVGEARLWMVVCRTVDSTGAASSVGYYVSLNEINTIESIQAVATAAHVVGPQITTGGTQWVVPGASSNNPATAADGAGNLQAFIWWYSILGTTPVLPLLHVATVLKNDLTLGTTVSIALVGTTAHTYLAASQSLAPGYVLSNAAQINNIMLWE